MVLINMLNHLLLNQYLENIINCFINIRNNSKKSSRGIKLNIFGIQHFEIEWLYRI